MPISLGILRQKSTDPFPFKDNSHLIEVYQQTVTDDRANKINTELQLEHN